MGRATPLTASEYEQVDNTTRVHSTPSTPAHSCCPPNYLQQRPLRFQTHTFPPFIYLLLCIKKREKNETIVSYSAALAKCHMACITIASGTSKRVSINFETHEKVALWQLVADTWTNKDIREEFSQIMVKKWYEQLAQSNKLRFQLWGAIQILHCIQNEKEVEIRLTLYRTRSTTGKRQEHLPPQGCTSFNMLFWNHTLSRNMRRDPDLQ